MFLRFKYLLKETVHDVEVPDDAQFAKKELVIVRTPDQGEDFGEVIAVFKDKTFLEPDSEFSYVRKPNLPDMEAKERNEEKYEQLLEEISAKIKFYNLDMTPIQVRLTKDGGGIHFMFAAEERVDFRDLVKDLAGTYRKKIFLQQIGARDRSRLVGGFGVCGRELCCTTFLHTTPSVSMDAVRTQNIFYKDRDKLTGLCGKLKCCLNYELKEYDRLRKSMPNMGSIVTIKSREKSRLAHEGKVIGLSILDQMVRLFIEHNKEILTLPVTEISIKKQGKHEPEKIEQASSEGTVTHAS